jgi:serine/threonine protein kinase
MKFPPWDQSEPTDEQILAVTHVNNRQLYETGEMTHAARQQLRDAMVAEWKNAQKPRSNVVQTIYDVYTVIEHIGQGGNGNVYKVSDTAGTKFALKLLDPRTASDEKRKRFKNELGFCERNRHKNIVTVLDHGLIEGVPFYIMPCYSGSLRDLMKSGIKPNRVLPIFSQILDGVEAAHLQNVIHRDLKPENILFDDKAEMLVIADFGIAHFEEDALITAVETRDGFKLANFQYAAPEQRMRRQKVNHRADIYALGLILNELFTGTLALGTNHKTIDSVAPEYSYLDGLVSQMLCSDPLERPANIETVKRQLRAREQEFFAQQRLSESKQKVVLTTDLDDPFVIDPPKLIDWDWEPNQLTLVLTRGVDERWLYALKSMGDHSAILGKGPEEFEFRENRAVIPARESEVEQLINHFKDWMPKANKRYEELARQEIVEQQAKERRRLQAEIDANEARARLRKNIKL